MTINLSAPKHVTDDASPISQRYYFLKAQYHREEVDMQKDFIENQNK
jgi:hypothetical protein